MINRLVFFVVLLAITFSAAVARPLDVAPAIRLVLAEGVDVERAAELTGPLGRLFKREPGAYLLYVAPEVDYAEALERIEASKLFTETEPVPPVLPNQIIRQASVSRLAQAIEDYKTGYLKFLEATEPEEAREEEDEDGDEKGEFPGLEFIEAYLDFLRQRAYPYDEVDWTAYRRSMDLRLRTVNPNYGVISEQAGPPTGAKWEYIGPRNLDTPYRIYWGLPPVSGRVNAVSFVPGNPDHFYMAGAQGGLWKTTDRGQNWVPLGDYWPQLQVSSIAIHPLQPETVLVGTGDFHGFNGYAYGIMKSTDGGQTWNNYGQTVFQGRAVSDLLIHPEDPNIVLATTGRGNSWHGKLYRSTDGGETWTAVISDDIAWASLSAGALPIDENLERPLYASGNGNNGGIWRSEDAGQNWSRMTPPTGDYDSFYEVQLVAASKIFEDRVYAMNSSPTRDNNKIYRSDDGGLTWTNVTNDFPDGDNHYNWSQYWYNNSFETSWWFDSDNLPQDIIYAGQIDLAFSVDSGASWRAIGGEGYSETYSWDAVTHNDQHSLAVNAGDRFQVLVGNDGGVYLGEYDFANDEFNYENLNATAGITQFYSGAIHPFDPDYAMGGTQDNATPNSRGDLMDWDNVGGGDGAGVAINPQDPDIQYASAQFNGLYRTLDGWQSTEWNWRPNWGNDRQPFIGTIEMDPSDPNRVYFGTDYLWRWNEDTDAWDERLGGTRLTNGTLRSIEVAPSDSSRIYTGGSNSEVYTSSDGGATWTRIDGGLPNRSISAISVSPSNPREILVALSGTNTGRVWRCVLDENEVPTWYDISGVGANALPNVSINDIERDPFAPHTVLYAGTDFGIYLSEDAGATWVDLVLTQEMPAVQVNEIMVNDELGYVYAATFGRGMWRLSNRAEAVGIEFLLDLPSVENLSGVPVDVRFQELVSSYTVEESSLALDGQGEARAETRLRGDYAVWMKPESHLSRVVELNIAESGNLVESTFLAGDADGDNRIGAGDYLLLVQAYRSLAGEANYDVRVDFNRDGHVGAQDFLILVANYGQVGQ